MKTLIIELTEDQKTYIEKENYEANGYMNLVNQFTSVTKFDVNEERYNQLIDSYLEHFISYNIYLSLIIDNYMQENQLDRSKYLIKSIDCNFISSQLILTYVLTNN